MSREEQARILSMVAEGRLTAEEAADLLDAIAPAPRPEPRSQAEYGTYSNSGYVATQGQPIRRAASRSLVIQVREGDSNVMNLRIPLGLARAAGRFVPRIGQRHLEKYDINLEQLMEDLGTAVVAGPLLQVGEGDNEVRITVE